MQKWELKGSVLSDYRAICRDFIQLKG